MKFTKLGLGLVALTLVVPTASALAQTQEESDAWEKAAKEYNDAQKQKDLEDYVKKNIDTPTGKVEKAREDAYKDKAEKAYNEELKKQGQAKKPEIKKPVEKKAKAKVLSKTSAVR